LIVLVLFICWQFFVEATQLLDLHFPSYPFYIS
jgi:hypothetical protein